MEKDKMSKELVNLISIAIDVLKDNWDADKIWNKKDIDLEAIVGNAQIILDAARTLRYCEGYYNDIKVEDKKTEDKRLFRFEYSTKMYSGELTKYFTFDEITEGQGFSEYDKGCIDVLDVNAGKVISDGDITVIRVR